MNKFENKYRKELNSITASESFKASTKELLSKNIVSTQNSQKSKTIIFSKKYITIAASFAIFALAGTVLWRSGALSNLSNRQNFSQEMSSSTAGQAVEDDVFDYSQDDIAPYPDEGGLDGAQAKSFNSCATATNLYWLNQGEELPLSNRINAEEAVTLNALPIYLDENNYYEIESIFTEEEMKQIINNAADAFYLLPINEEPYFDINNTNGITTVSKEFKNGEVIVEAEGSVGVNLFNISQSGIELPPQDKESPYLHTTYAAYLEDILSSFLEPFFGQNTFSHAYLESSFDYENEWQYIIMPEDSIYDNKLLNNSLLYTDSAYISYNKSNGLTINIDAGNYLGSLMESTDAISLVSPIDVYYQVRDTVQEFSRENASVNAYLDSTVNVYDGFEDLPNDIEIVYMEAENGYFIPFYKFYVKTADADGKDLYVSTCAPAIDVEAASCDEAIVWQDAN